MLHGVVLGVTHDVPINDIISIVNNNDVIIMIMITLAERDEARPHG